MKIFAVGLGPGAAEYLAPGAREAILRSDVIIGYTGYIELLADLVNGKRVISTGMTGEVERCEAAIREALNGEQVCVVSGGDAGIYGMASLLFELAEKHPGVEIEVIPGITAAVAAAAVLGSPLTNDFAVISLSDLLTPWDLIEKRLEAAASADFVICLYNPQSVNRSGYLEKACDIALRHKPPGTVCGYVRNALRSRANSITGECCICTLAELRQAQADMQTTVIIGNVNTRVISGKLVTARGYML